MNWKQPKVYAVKHKDEATRAASRSGGIFTALSDQVLSNGGVIYGCILTDDFNAVHIRADSTEERNRMRGSKYIQSRLGNTFKNVKVDLDAQRSVLFSGTSCQVAGLEKYLGKEYDNLFCVDIVCHGVPSKKVWDAYLHWHKAVHLPQESVDTKVSATPEAVPETDESWAEIIEFGLTASSTSSAKRASPWIWRCRPSVRPR